MKFEVKQTVPITQTILLPIDDIEKRKSVSAEELAQKEKDKQMAENMQNILAKKEQVRYVHNNHQNITLNVVEES